MRTYFFSKRRTRVSIKKSVDKVRRVDKIILVKSFLNITTTNFCSNSIINLKKDFFKSIDYFAKKAIICYRKLTKEAVICRREAIICFLEVFRKKIDFFVKNSKIDVFNRLER